MIGPQLNSAVLNHLISQGFESIEIMPMLGYEDTSPPFILWTEFDISTGYENPIIQESTVMYHIYDTSVKTALDIEYHMKRFLTPEHNVANLNSLITIPNLQYRIICSSLLGGGLYPPLEREGFISKALMISVCYVYANQTE